VSGSGGSVKAARLLDLGRPLVAQTVGLSPPGDDEVRVQLRYGGVNPIDRYLAQGLVGAQGPLPRTLGGEASGNLDDGTAVLVAGEGLGSTRDGVWASAAVVPMAAVYRLPERVRLREAAAMGIAGLTAWQAVHELAAVQAHDRVLVLGASGGVGSIIVSLAAAAGATVWGQTGSREKAALIEQQGGARALIGGAQELPSALAELEPTAVFDPLGGDFVGVAVEALVPRGRLVSFGTSAGAKVSFDMQALYRKMLTVFGYGGMQLGTEERRRGLAAALEALGDGRLRVPVGEVLALEDVGEAFSRLEQRRVQGKLLLEL
jgi:NADPH:quinone reductase